MSLLSTKFWQTFSKSFTIFWFLSISLGEIQFINADCDAGVFSMTPVGCGGITTGSVSFVLTPAEAGRTYSYTGTSSGGGTLFTRSAFFDLGGFAQGPYEITFNTSAGSCKTNFNMITASVVRGLTIVVFPTTCDCGGVISPSVDHTENLFPPITYTYHMTGSNGYSSTIDTADTSVTFSNLCGGSYSYTITAHGFLSEGEDSPACDVFTSDSVFLPGGGPMPVASITGGGSFITGDTVSLNGHPDPFSLTPPGPGLTYSWTGPNAFTANTQNISFTASALTAGTYALQVCNPSNGASQCCTTTTADVAVESACEINITVTPVSSSCFGQNMGEVTVSFTESGTTTPPFFYNLDNTGFQSVPSNPFNLTGLAPLSHSIVIQDTSTTCTGTQQFAVEGTCCLVEQDSNQQPSCANAPTGSIDVEVFSQIGQVSYSIDGGVTYINVLTNPFTVPNLPPGNTIILIKDGGTPACQPLSIPVFIVTRPTPTVTIGGITDICGTTGALLTATPSGGAGGPYTFSWSTGSMINTTPVTQPGLYSVTITDSAGCTGTTSTMVNAELTAAIVTADPALCANGSVLLTALPAPTGTFSYQWSFNGNPILGATTATFTATQLGNYSATITDHNVLACTATTSIDVIQSTTCGDLAISLSCKKKVKADDKNTRLGVTITNIGSSPVSGIVVTDVLPGCFTFKKGIGENWNFIDGQPVKATFNGLLQPGASTTFTLCVETHCATAGCSGSNNVLNQVTVTGNNIETRTGLCIIKIN